MDKNYDMLLFNRKGTVTVGTLLWRERNKALEDVLFEGNHRCVHGGPCPWC